MQIEKIKHTDIARIKTRGQQEADKLLATGEYMTTQAVATLMGVSKMTARERMVSPDKACGGGQKIYLYSRKRVESVRDSYQKRILNG
jgi:hypothetical protein